MQPDATKSETVSEPNRNCQDILSEDQADRLRNAITGFPVPAGHGDGNGGMIPWSKEEQSGWDAAIDMVTLVLALSVKDDPAPTPPAGLDLPSGPGVWMQALDGLLVVIDVFRDCHGDLWFWRFGDGLASRMDSLSQSGWRQLSHGDGREVERLKEQLSKAVRLAADYKEGCQSHARYLTEIGNALGLEGNAFLGFGVNTIKESIATLTAKAERLKARIPLMPLGPCEVCWTNSWVPVPADDPDAQALKDGSGFVRCDHCWLTAKLAEAERLLPSTFYADRPLLERLSLFVHDWRRSKEASNVLEDKLAEADAASDAARAENERLRGSLKKICTNVGSALSGDNYNGYVRYLQLIDRLAMEALNKRTVQP